MRDLDYEGSTADVNDELKPYIMKMFDMDGVLFATPIWWGHSCHIQAMLERLDFIYSWARTTNINLLQQSIWHIGVRRRRWIPTHSRCAILGG